ncbi:D-glycero-alpha-D-manno-heptose 1-phosphate guanylyltransferase [compost metagenome]|uniref:HAD family hydrolase n=1 Tax=Pseudomonas putida S12 TaxID=1215087 RepID=A0AA34RRJ7_PSEPU|nr:MULTISPECIES: sugar phosphate nucleotidyltransferase [Pseudomonas]ADR59146.1 HAD superfamily hydrolase [Pseudomonas putida BIRD-1]AJA12156.1 HAD family hydrolase [Pseudomonas putida S12]AOX08214.1 HAD family hydrolase [Pseudomonas putida JB]MCI1022579.1 NTP transferase domain-containing protein [Pseudomonas putida]MDN4514444.1 sugar phosphate nucleotidyltransferase [Pseudomonas sp. 2,4-D]
MRAYVLCGGFGTRLRSVTDSQKALVPVRGEPFLARVLSQLARAGVSEGVLCAHYRAEQVAEQLAELSRQAGLPLSMVVEENPLGTGGALLNALREQPAQGRYLVLNADTFVEVQGYRQMLQSEGNAVLAARVSDRSRYGSLALTATGHMAALQEKGVPGAGLINAGVYAFTASAFTTTPVRACSMEHDLLPELLQQAAVTVVDYSGRFIDIGTPESLARYTHEFLPDTSL